MLIAPDLDRNGPVPIYLQIEDWMRQQVVDLIWPRHFKLMAEADLAVELGVSRGTVRKAISNLITEGLLMRAHGRGTFVASNVLEQPLAERLITFSEDLISKGIPFETVVLAQKVVPATARIATSMAVSPGTNIFFLKRLRLVEEKPLILLNNYVAYDRCPTIATTDFTHKRLFEALEDDFGLHLNYGQRSFQARVAETDVAVLLGIAKDNPVMYLEQLTYLDDGSVIEFSDLWLRGDRFKFSAAVTRHGLNPGGVSVSMI